MKPLLIALLVCAACKHSTSSSSTSHTETSTVTDTQTSESGATTTTTTVETDPGETVTTISEYDPPEQEEAAPIQEPPPPIAGSSPRKVPTLPRRGPLRKQTVIDEKHGASTATTAQQATREAQGTTETKAQGKADVRAQETESSKPALSCAAGGWLAIVGIVVAVFGLAFFALKRRGIV